MTGDGFPATIRVSAVDGNTWTGDGCTVSLGEHDYVEPAELGDEYRVSGTGECAAPLTDDAAGSITVSPFEFVVSVTWAN